MRKKSTPAPAQEQTGQQEPDAAKDAAHRATYESTAPTDADVQRRRRTGLEQLFDSGLADRFLAFGDEFQHPTNAAAMIFPNGVPKGRYGK